MHVCVCELWCVRVHVCVRMVRLCAYVRMCVCVVVGVGACGCMCAYVCAFV